LHAFRQSQKILFKRIQIQNERGSIDVLQPVADLRRGAHRYAAAAFCARWRSAYQAIAIATMATSGSAIMLTRAQPPVVTVRPEVKGRDRHHDEDRLVVGALRLGAFLGTVGLGEQRRAANVEEIPADAEHDQRPPELRHRDAGKAMPIATM